jgi:hypothetical protein
MAKKQFFLRAIFFVAPLLTAAGLYAYNPPVGGENLFHYGHADLTSQTASAAGGAIFSATPQSIIINPALVAEIQRVSIDAGYTGLFPTKDSTIKLGTGLQLGVVFPTRWGVATGALQGAFVPVESMPLGNSVTARAAFSRDITDNLYVGIALFGGFDSVPDESTDWAIGGDIGVMYRFGSLGALHDLRVGAAFVNLGKTYVVSVPGLKSGESDFFPGIVTPRVGMAALFLDKEKLKAGFSLDVSAPLFHNVILDVGAQICFANIVTLSTGWHFNASEAFNEHLSLIPSIGVSVKFVVNTGSSEFMSSKGWSASDIITSANYTQIYDGIQQVSIGVTANLGLKDTEGPVITLWEEE